MEISFKLTEEFKKLMEKESGKEVSLGDASEGARNLAGLVEILYDCWVEDKKRKKKLKEFPKGFQLDGVGYSCFVCGNGTPAGGNYYDKYGIKCMVCQGAVDRKEVPAWVAKYKDGWYSKYDMESRFNLKTPILKKWIKSGILKVCTVTRDGQRSHTQLFLLKDNKDFLPPKKLTESYAVKETKDGEDWYCLEPWYRFVEPFEHLKGYRIMDYLKFTKEGEEC